MPASPSAGGGPSSSSAAALPAIEGIQFVDYVDEEQLDDVMRLVGQDLSEPYSGELAVYVMAARVGWWDGGRLKLFLCMLCTDV